MDLFACCVWTILALVFIQATTVTGSCTFPASLQGQWDRGHDGKTFTFTTSTASGFDFTYFSNSITNFDCLSSSGNKYILSSDFTTTSSQPYRYLVCWELVEVTPSAFILYELTDDLSALNNINPIGPGITKPQADPAVSESDICNKATGSTFFTTLIKDGATSTDVAVQCPESLFATFTYSQCPGSSLNFCTDRTTATADYTSCPAILNSNGGVLSCMGFVDRSPDVYVNMFKHDAGNGVTCLKITSGAGGAVSAEFFTGDCTTATGSGTALSLTPTVTCPLTTAGPPTTGAVVVGTTVGSNNDDGAASASAAVVGGSVVAVAAVAGVVVVAGYVIVKKKQTTIVKVHDLGGSVSPLTEKPLPAITSSTTTTTMTSSVAPVNTNGDFSFPDVNHSPRRLPPIASAETTGEPLRV